jgi:DNA-binding GntR family transcriptional regulator
MMRNSKGSPGLGQLALPASLTEKAKEVLKQAIIKGQFSADAVYSEQVIAGELGISKTPVHHALLELETKGFVSILPRRGFKVNRLSRQELVELFEFRSALECAVVRNLAGGVSPGGLAQLEELLAEHKSTQDPSQFIRVDRDFHEKMAELSGNRYLIRSLNDIWDMVEWLGVTNLRAAMTGELITSGNTQVELPRMEHLNMLDAIKKGDPAAAQEAVLNHLERVKNRYLELWDGQNPGSA